MFEAPKSPDKDPKEPDKKAPESPKEKRNLFEIFKARRKERAEAEAEEKLDHDEEIKAADEKLGKELSEAPKSEPPKPVESEQPVEDENLGLIEHASRYGNPVNAFSIAIARRYTTPGNGPHVDEGLGEKLTRQAAIVVLQFTSGMSPKWVTQLSPDQLEALEANLGMQVRIVGDKEKPDSIKIKWVEVEPKVDSTFTRNMESTFGGNWEKAVTEVWPDLKPETTLKEAEAALNGKTGEKFDQANALIQTLREKGVQDGDSLQTFLEGTELPAVKLEREIQSYEGTPEERKQENEEVDAIIREAQSEIKKDKIEDFEADLAELAPDERNSEPK